jgi:pimeloyl-ACP methyl ester carboxylesterase
MSDAAWNAVTPYLRPTRRVIVFDVAGFGSTPPLPSGTLPTIANLVDHLDRSIPELGIEAPTDIAGNSLGGAMALEAAKRGIARSVVAISPIGLWKHRPAPHVKSELTRRNAGVSIGDRVDVRIAAAAKPPKS